MCKHKMDATPSFGVTMIPEVPSNPQLTLNAKLPFYIRRYMLQHFFPRDCVIFFGQRTSTPYGVINFVWKKL